MAEQNSQQGGIVASLIASAIGFGAAKLASLGVHLDPSAQAGIAVAVYGVLHRFLGRFGI